MVLAKAGGQLHVEQDTNLARLRQYFSVRRNLTSTIMGVTIHFEGKLASLGDYDELVLRIDKFAKKRNYEVLQIDENDKVLYRVKDEQDCDYKGPTKGVCLQLDDNCDPFILEFDENLYMQDFCKTQFSNIEVHIEIVSLLRMLAPIFAELVVEDEGEYWDTNDITILRQNLDACYSAIEDAKAKNASLQGPFRLADGRIADLLDMSNSA
jgi:hypothetical protein